MTGNRVLTKTDIDSILQEFKENLTDKNVASEIAEEICISVKESLVG
jgi:signal recognition particle receptor subunit alpha|tara:strand:+ start:147 stop:287 length:141 start_codon:yes stop_codon:yes gene_type:complete